MKEIKIKSRKQTIKRRKSMICKTYELKVDMSKLSQKTLEDFRRLFLEAKWFYNYLLSQENIFDINTTHIKQVIVMNKDKTTRIEEFKIIPAKFKQIIREQIVISIKSLSTKKKRKQKIGKLKFKSFVKCILLDNQCYKIKENNYIDLLKIKQYLKVNGLNQIFKESEFANAFLIRKHGSYFLNVVTFLPKEKPIECAKAIGIDFGIKTQMTFSNGIKAEFKIPVSRRVKKLHQNLSRKTKGSHNHFKNKLQLEKAYSKTNNIKKDISKKIIHYLKNNYIICIQNDNIKAWMSYNFGKQINESAIGGIISGLKQIPETLVAHRFFPSTKTCYNCGHIQKVDLGERVFVCEKCFYTEDRDINSAKNILKRSFEVLPERKEFTLAENETSTLKMLEYLNNIPHLKASLCSLKQEAIL